MRTKLFFVGVIVASILFILIANVLFARGADANLNVEYQDRYVIADVAGQVMGDAKDCRVYKKLQKVDTSSARTFKDALQARNDDVC